MFKLVFLTITLALVVQILAEPDICPSFPPVSDKVCQCAVQYCAKDQRTLNSISNSKLCADVRAATDCGQIPDDDCQRCFICNDQVVQLREEDGSEIMVE